MNSRFTSFLLLFLVLMTFTGCSVIVDIFRAGVWFAILSIIILVVLLVLILRSVSYKPEKEAAVRQKGPDLH